MPDNVIPFLNGAHVTMSTSEVTRHLWTVITSIRRIADNVEMIRAEKLYDQLPDQVHELGETLSMLQEVTVSTAPRSQRVVDMGPEATQDEPQQITPMRSDDRPTVEELERDD